MPLAHTRAALLAHVHNTNRQEHLPAIGTKIAYQTNRDGGAERWAAPAVPKSLDVDVALLPSDAARLRDVDLPMVQTARPQDATTRSLRHTVPGSGQRRSRVVLSAIPPIHRCPRGQDGVASCRRGQGAHSSAGQRRGTAGAQLGQAHRTWALSAAASVVLSDQPAAQHYRARWETTHDKGPAGTRLAPPLARAVSARRKRLVAFDKEPCFQCSGRGAEKPGASRDNNALPLHGALDTA